MSDVYEALAMTKPIWYYGVMLAVVLLGVTAIIILV